MEHGRNGKYTRVKGTDYVACDVYTSPCDPPHRCFFTSFRHVGDDPLFEFYTIEKNPWLTKRQVERLNATHKANYRLRLATMNSYTNDIGHIMDMEAYEEVMYPIRKEFWNNPKDLMIIQDFDNSDFDTAMLFKYADVSAALRP